MNSHSPSTTEKKKIDIELVHYDLVVVNSSAGKDSLCTLYEIWRMAKEQNYPSSQVLVSHQDLGEMEWEGTKELAAEQAKIFGFNIQYSRRRNAQGYEENLLEYVERRGKWPSSKQRYCTSDFKRGPGARVITGVTKEMKESNILHVFGFRAEESPSRSKKEQFCFNNRLSTKSRKVWDYLPIHDWTENDVWVTIKANGLPYHHAYDLGMPRLSCVFCIFSPFDALVVAGKNNPELLDRYVEVEERIGHKFKQQHSIADVKKEIDAGYEPDNIENWRM